MHPHGIVEDDQSAVDQRGDESRNHCPPQLGHGGDQGSVGGIPCSPQRSFAPELKMKADELKVGHGPNVTKGNLLRMIRESVNTPDQELMKVGQYRGYEFREVPESYARWASEELKNAKSMDPDLVMFVRWWEAKQAPSHIAQDGSRDLRRQLVR